MHTSTKNERRNATETDTSPPMLATSAMPNHIRTQILLNPPSLERTVAL